LNLPSLPFAKFIELTGFSTPLACWEDSLVQSWMVRFVNKVEQVARHVERPEKSAPVLMRASNESFFFFFKNLTGYALQLPISMLRLFISEWGKKKS
jgi:hypothetical protein